MGTGDVLDRLDQLVTQLLEASGETLASAESSPARLSAAQLPAARLSTVDLSTVDLSTRLLRTLTIINRLHALVVADVGAFDRRRGWVGSGHLTTKTWLQAFARLSGPAARGLVRAAHMVPQLPELTAAFGDGAVSLDHVQRIVALHGDVGPEPVAEVESTLVGLARSGDPSELQRACDHVRHWVRPDGPEPDPVRRSLTLSRTGSGWSLRGWLDREGGAVVQSALDAFMVAPVPGDGRDAATRRHDALVEMARDCMREGRTPKAGGVRPSVALLFPYQVLDPDLFAGRDPAHPADPDTGDPAPGRSGSDGVGGWASGRAGSDGVGDSAPGRADPDGAGRGGARPGDGDLADVGFGGVARAGGVPEPNGGPTGPAAGSSARPVGRPPGSLAGGSPVRPEFGSWWSQPAWLDWFGPVPVETARRILCDCDIYRVVLDPATSLPLDVGRAYRLAPPWLRRLLWARDRGCRFPGCTAPSQWTDAHHVLEWKADHGPTAMDNLISLCRAHHVLVHEGGWHLHYAPTTGALTVTRPDGTPYELGPTRAFAGMIRTPRP